MPNYKKCFFVKSATELKHCPESNGEIAFVGRSNAGKSSAINYLTQSRIAKTSKTPGRTQLINFFQCDERLFLVDLPGYGYAKVPLAEKKKWQEFLTKYLNRRDPLIGLVLVMDIRHPLQDIDYVMLDYSIKSGLPIHIILTKADKLSKNKQKTTLLLVEKECDKLSKNISVQLFSTHKKQGAEELSKMLDNLFFRELDLAKNP